MATVANLEKKNKTTFRNRDTKLHKNYYKLLFINKINKFHVKVRARTLTDMVA